MPFCSPGTLESYLVQAVQDKVLSLRIDHHTKSIHFGVNLFAYNGNVVDSGPRLQSMQTEMVNGQLTTMSRRLHAVIHMMNPQAKIQHETERREHLLQDINGMVS